MGHVYSSTHHPTRWAHPFKRPVTDKEAPDYKGIVKNPMDLSTLRKRVESGAVSEVAALVGHLAPHPRPKPWLQTLAPNPRPKTPALGPQS